MEDLIKAVDTTPIIDHHAHNLLTASDIDAHEMMAITTEADGPALEQTSSTLAHLRAVKGLAQILKCEPNWDAVQKAIQSRREEPDDAWAQRCFQGIETVLIDDGLDPSNVHPYDWHSRLTRSNCKRIVRIERIAESILRGQLVEFSNVSAENRDFFRQEVVSRFDRAITEAIADPEVAGFKSVICYRVGLAIPANINSDMKEAFLSFLDNGDNVLRLEHKELSPYFVHLTTQALQRLKSRKPLQFHTGLGDNDINLGLSNPSHLQPFIEAYPEVSIVLLHASYPFTAQAGYLASVYENCYLDIGEVFPMVSQDGQEKIIREALELCPSEKLLWSTDGHWFPETYILAVDQVREGMRQVLGEYVIRGSLTSTQAIKVVQDIFFNTSNKLYQLGLPLRPIKPLNVDDFPTEGPSESWTNNLAHLKVFLRKYPSIQWLRLQWLDYTATPRMRMLPIKQALKLFAAHKSIGITKAVLGLLQPDEAVPGFTATGEYSLYPCLEGLRLGTRANTGIVQCEFQEKATNEEVPICPRTLLRRQVEKAAGQGIGYLVGFEVEIVFMSRKKVEGGFSYGDLPVNEGGHSWSNARAVQNDDLMDFFEQIFEKLENAGIELQQFHPESSPGQYEFILGPLPPLQAVDTLLAAREIIIITAANAGMRATLIPKPAPTSPGTGAHVHISMTPSTHWEPFYAGILKHMRAISAFTYSNDASYERVVDGVWAGSTWVCWGTQNRETPLRSIDGPHFEMKCMDGLANPYLALAAIFGAGLQGVEDKEPLRMKDCLDDPASLSVEKRKEFGIKDKFPTGIEEAVDALEADKQLCELLGPAADVYARVKRAENEMLKKMEPDERRNWLIERY